MKPAKQLFTKIILLTICSLIIIFWSWAYQNEKALSLYDPNSDHPFGLKALHLLLQETGWSYQTTTSFPPDLQKPLVLLSTTLLSPEDQQQLLEWVQKGGTVLEVALNYPNLEIPAPPNDQNKEKSFLHSVHLTKYAYTSKVFPFQELVYHLNNETAATNSFFLAPNPTQGFYGTKQGYFIYVHNYGAGILIGFNNLSGLTNKHLHQHPDNSVVFLMLLKKYFPTQEFLIYQTSNNPAGPAVQQSANYYEQYFLGAGILLIGLGLLLWQSTRRFGRKRPLINAQSPVANEFVFSLAYLFQTADARNLVLTNLWEALLEMITKITDQTRHTPLEIIIMRLNQLTGKDYRRLIMLQETLNHPQYRKGSKKQFLELVRELDNYREELAKWKKSNQHFML